MILLNSLYVLIRLVAVLNFRAVDAPRLVHKRLLGILSRGNLFEEVHGKDEANELNNANRKTSAANCRERLGRCFIQLGMTRVFYIVQSRTGGRVGVVSHVHESAASEIDLDGFNGSKGLGRVRGH